MKSRDAEILGRQTAACGTGQLRPSFDAHVRENLTLGVAYLFDPYRLDDFMWDIMDPWIPDRLTVENFADRYLFLNARDSNYTGHVASVTLRYTF